ncbi:MAG: MmcQ/YjbR family DNA-binding protein [Paramuribaculum sp.]|nr:MmcQ/YjbR family DNA-binding protein [Paramuribaculum sp.]MDE6303395.1 MmcQ/YjbR family DNA-binding protein [Paramuribaculum sp.]
MNVEDFRDFCLAMKGAEEKSPWTEPQYRDLITFSIGGKWFSLFDPVNRFTDLKCTPEHILELQERYEGCFPAWHMNKQHWLGVRLESDVPDNVIKQLVTDAYNLIVASLPKKTKAELGI